MFHRRERHNQRALLSVRGVSKVFGQGEATARALDEATLRINPREFIILFGPSGCGKSTLLNILSGLEHPTSGELLWGGQNIALWDNRRLSEYHRRNVGMIFQSYQLIRHLSVLDNVVLPMLPECMSHHTRIARAMQAIRMVGLGKFAHRMPPDLSGGQQQRIGIARAIVNRPRLILADEPTGNLDTKSSREIMWLIARFHRQGAVVVMVTHNPDQLSFATRVVYMRDGRVVRQDWPRVRKAFSMFARNRHARTVHDLQAEFALSELVKNKKIDSRVHARLHREISAVAREGKGYERLCEVFARPENKGGFGADAAKAAELAETVMDLLPALRKEV